MKTLTKTVLAATALAFSLSVNAAGSKTDSAMLAECKALVTSQIENAEKIKVANIKSRRDIFKAKFRVTAAGDRSVVLCTIADDQPIALSCVGGDVCAVNTIAAN